MATTGTTGASFNVRELLELERQLYQESIERVATQHKELLRGTLEDFVLRCVPFEDEKGWETEAAMVQLQLNKRNGLDLLEFELKQAEDVHQARCKELKQQLLKAASKRLENLQKRATLLDQGYSPQVAGVELKLKLKSNRTKKRCKLNASDFQSPASTEELAVESRELLAKQVERLQKRNREAFNLQHLEYGIPPAKKIADEVFDELELLKSKQEQFGDGVTPPDAKVYVNVYEQELSIEDVASGSSATATFHVEDFVILTSRVTDEEFHGQIREITDEDVRFVLICGTPARATIAALQSGKCALKHQPPPVSSLGDEDEMRRTLYDERTILDTKQIRLRKKGRRRRAVDIRCGF